MSSMAPQSLAYKKKKINLKSKLATKIAQRHQYVSKNVTKLGVILEPFFEKIMGYIVQGFFQKIPHFKPNSVHSTKTSLLTYLQFILLFTSLHFCLYTCTK